MRFGFLGVLRRKLALRVHRWAQVVLAQSLEVRATSEAPAPAPPPPNEGASSSPRVPDRDVPPAPAESPRPEAGPGAAFPWHFSAPAQPGWLGKPRCGDRRRWLTTPRPTEREVPAKEPASERPEEEHRPQPERARRDAGRPSVPSEAPQGPSSGGDGDASRTPLGRSEAARDRSLGAHDTSESGARPATVHEPRADRDDQEPSPRAHKTGDAPTADDERESEGHAAPNRTGLAPREQPETEEPGAIVVDLDGEAFHRGPQHEPSSWTVVKVPLGSSEPPVAEPPPLTEPATTEEPRARVRDPWPVLPVRRRDRGTEVSAPTPRGPRPTPSWPLALSSRGGAGVEPAGEGSSDRPWPDLPEDPWEFVDEIAALLQKPPHTHHARVRVEDAE